SAVYFNSQYENLIGFSPITYRFANLSRADISGIEISARFTIFEDLSFMAAYTYLHTADLQYERELLRRPKHSLATLLSYKNRYFTLSGEMAYVGKRLDYNELTWSVDHSPAFNTFNLNAAVPLNKNFSITGKITNAFGKEYQEIMGYPAPARRFLIGIRYKGTE
ncbi:MAG: TonB-dependent receptor, partial [Candidatus Aminicenantes bacterium]|nr:TonB-dependent receptor [Candidatus Aminicenantes bacterium]